MVESRHDLMKDEIADATEWPLKFISGAINNFIVCISNVQDIHAEA